MNTSDMICIGGPYNSFNRAEMLDLKNAADLLKNTGVKYKLTQKKRGLKGKTTIFHLWRSPDGIVRAETRKDTGAGIVVMSKPRGGVGPTSFKPKHRKP